MLAEQRSGGAEASGRPDLDDHRLSRGGTLKHIEIQLVFGSRTQLTGPHVFHYADDLGTLVLGQDDVLAERTYTREISPGDRFAHNRHQRSSRVIAISEIAP